MFTKEEFIEKYKRLTDDKIISLYNEKGKLTPDAFKALIYTINYRKLQINNISETQFQESEIIENNVQSHIDNTKKFFVSNNSMRRTAYIYFTFSIITFLSGLFSQVYFLLIFSIVTLVLGLYFSDKKDQFVQFEIREFDILFYKRRNYTKFSFTDFYNLYLEGKPDIITFQEIKIVLIFNSFFEGQKLYFMTKNEDKIEALLNINSNGINQIAEELKKKVDVKIM
jgi:hypothetical protein